jgi:hypothetical protein
VAAYLVAVVCFAVIAVVLEGVFQVHWIHLVRDMPMPPIRAIDWWWYNIPDEEVALYALQSLLMPALLAGFLAMRFRALRKRPRLNPAVEQDARARFAPTRRQLEPGQGNPDGVQSIEQARGNESAD